MKKTIIIIALLIAVIGVFVYSYQYRSEKIASEPSVSATIHTTAADTTASNQEDEQGRRLVAEDKKNDWQIYYDGTNTEIIHGDYKRVITSWSYSFDCEDPTMYCKDYDGDGEVEMMLRIVSGKLEEQYDPDMSPYTYSLYMFEPYTSSTGEKTLSSIVASDDTWKNPFAEAINCEMTQLKSCKKFLQFTMNDAEETITYNEKTGITTNKYVGYGLALCSNSKTYYTLDRWNRGAGIYNLDKNGNISLDIQVLVNYKEISDTQYIGNIHCGMEIVDGAFILKPNTIVFNSVDPYKVSDPRDTAKKKWNYTIKNASSGTTFKSTTIDWIEADFDLEGTAKQITQPFDSMASKIKCVDSVKFTEKSVVLTAKDGYSFSNVITGSGNFSVLINSGTDDEYDISYDCAVKNEGNTSTLTINFDKTYDREDLDNVTINFGV